MEGNDTELTAYWGSPLKSGQLHFMRKIYLKQCHTVYVGRGFIQDFFLEGRLCDSEQTHMKERAYTAGLGACQQGVKLTVAWAPLATIKRLWATRYHLLGANLGDLE